MVGHLGESRMPLPRSSGSADLKNLELISVSSRAINGNYCSCTFVSTISYLNSELTTRFSTSLSAK